MNLFKKTTVKMRLLILLGFAGLVIVLVGLNGLRTLGIASDAVDAMYAERLVPAWQMGKIMNEQMENTKLFLNAVSSRSVSQSQNIRDEFQDNRAQVRELWTSFQESVHSDEERQLAEDFVQRRKEFNQIAMPVFDVMASGDFETARTLRDSRVGPAFAPLQAAGEALLEYQLAAAQRVMDEVNAVEDSNETMTVAAIIISLLIIGAFGLFLINSIRRPIESILKVMRDISRGKLGHIIEVDGEDELSEMLASLRTMDERLADIVGDVSESSETVSSSAMQISQGNDDLSQRTQEQASSLEETASSMEEMTATVKQNADNANQANQLAASAREQAEKGGAVVNNAVNAMREINDSSKQIVDIIGVIDEIAFQTNLLALNAAVEAARAGEQGRGFAVVATEVRNLAQRSAKAAHEIKDLINDSVEKVDGGSKLVEESGQVLQGIRESVRKVTDIVAEIAAASQEQSSGIEQVNSAVMQMDQMTQQNAALVEEAAAASRSMEEQARRLIDKVSFFRIEDERVVKKPVQMKRPETAEQKPSAPRTSSQPSAAAAQSAGPKVSGATNGKAVENVWQEF